MKTNFLGLNLNSDLVLAPLAGVSDSVYRYLCKEEGAALTYTEMVSAKGLYYESENTKELLSIDEREGNVGIQLFGSEPDIIAFAVKKLADYPNVLFDINMGCPVPKIVKNHEGSFLLSDLELAKSIVEAAKKASDETSKKPVTVKMRIGFGTANDYVLFAKGIEAAGADAITVHGRTREQYYSGNANWDAIKEIRKAVSIPVIGNGVIKSLEHAAKMKEYSKVDLLMIGRASMGNPWVFSGKEKDLSIMPGHFEMLLSKKGEHRACLEMRKYFAWYTKGILGASELRNSINTAKTPAEIFKIFDLLNNKEQ